MCARKQLRARPFEPNNRQQPYEVQSSSSFALPISTFPSLTRHPVCSTHPVKSRASCSSVRAWLVLSASMCACAISQHRWRSSAVSCFFSALRFKRCSCCKYRVDMTPGPSTCFTGDNSQSVQRLQRSIGFTPTSHTCMHRLLSSSLLLARSLCLSLCLSTSKTKHKRLAARQNQQNG